MWYPQEPRQCLAQSKCSLIFIRGTNAHFMKLFLACLQDNNKSKEPQSPTPIMIRTT